MSTTFTAATPESRLFDALFDPPLHITVIQDLVKAIRRAIASLSGAAKQGAIFWLKPLNEDALSHYETYPYLALMSRVREGVFATTEVALPHLPSFETNLGTIYWL